jgi:hypothetical protein
MTFQQPGSTGPGRPGQLNLTSEQEAAVEESIAATVAVNVYRQLKAAQETAGLRDTSCAIIVNCCSCSKAVSIALES